MHFTFLILLLLQFMLIIAKEEQSSLQFVFAMFRHGHRSNDYETIYPKDPYRNVSYYPYGWKQLTNGGKARAFELGQKLRARYGDFIGMYTPDVIDTLSTNINRTKMSLQLVLAGLFPPEGELVWNKDLLWLPIPYNYADSKDFRLQNVPAACPKRYKSLKNYIKTPQGNILNYRYKKWFNYVSEHSGLDIKGSMDLGLLYFGLLVEEEFGFKLPAWVKPVYPHILKSAIIDTYYLWNRNDELAKLGQVYSGHFSTKIEGTLNPVNRKIMLFSAHELNVASFLITVKTFDNDVPPYGACLMIELHKINEEHGFKIYYEKHTGGPPKEVIIPGCEHFCPLGKIKELLRNRIPDSYNLC